MKKIQPNLCDLCELCEKYALHDLQLFNLEL